MLVQVKGNKDLLIMTHLPELFETFFVVVARHILRLIHAEQRTQGSSFETRLLWRGFPMCFHM